MVIDSNDTDFQHRFAVARANIRRYAIPPAALRWSTAATLVPVLAGSLAGAAWAARPLITDDARVVDLQACQVESWVKKNRDSTEYWALPACNVTGNLELTFGGARTRNANAGGLYASDVQVQGKTLFKPLATNGWGLGLVAGTVRHPQLPARGG